MRTDGIPAALTARLAPGEEVLLHHRPDPQVYRFWRRFFLWMTGGMIAAGLGAVLVAAAGLSPLVKALFCLGALGLFAAFALLLGVEGRRLGRHAAIVTQRRILWANGGELRLVPGMQALASGNAVRIFHRGVQYRLFHSADKTALTAALNRILQAAAEGGKDA